MACVASISTPFSGSDGSVPSRRPAHLLQRSVCSRPSAVLALGLRGAVSACQECHTDVVQLLTIHGADPDVTAVDINGDEFTARTLAHHMGHRVIVDWLDMTAGLHRVHIAVCGSFEFPFGPPLTSVLALRYPAYVTPRCYPCESDADWCLHFNGMLRDS